MNLQMELNRQTLLDTEVGLAVPSNSSPDNA